MSRAGGRPDPPSLGPPAFPGDAPDPFVLVTADGYVAYSTEVAGVHVPARTSSDLRSWDGPVDALPVLPAWAEPGRTWAPSVVVAGGRHVLYATVRVRGTQQQSLAVGVGDGPLGPFRLADQPLLRPAGGTWAIDASPYRDQAGGLWLTWKSDLDRGAVALILARRLSDDGLDFAPGAPTVELLRSGARWEAGVVEAPCLVHVDGRTWLLYSGNRWPSSSYAVGLAAGPDHRPTPTEKLSTRRPWLASDRHGAGPGGQETFVDHDGQLRLVLHAWAPDRVGYDRGGARTTRVLTL